MTDIPSSQPPGWYYAQGDPVGTQRYWDGSTWQGGPQPVGGGYGATSQLADAGSRIGAWFVDLLVLIIPIFIISFAVAGGEQQSVFGASARQIVAGLLTTAVWFGYHVLMNSNGGQTLGRRAVSIKIVNMDGSEAGTDSLVKRFGVGLLNIIPFVNLVLWIVGLASLVLIFIDDDNQALWDKVANTKTIKA